jgi:ABC-2 type transport system ATP-binding protein
MKRFRIEHYLNKRAGDLSKGNQQKIQFIAAILHSPQLIILDEPFSGLDPVNVEELKKAVIDLKNEGATILFSSHRMEHVEELCEGICMIKNGNIVAKGSIEEIKSSYQKNKLMVQTEIDLHFAQKLEGVLSIEKVKNYHLITLDDEKKSHEVIKEIINHGMIKKFEIKEPTLNEIFIDKVGDKNE